MYYKYIKVYWAMQLIVGKKNYAQELHKRQAETINPSFF